VNAKRAHPSGLKQIRCASTPGNRTRAVSPVCDRAPWSQETPGSMAEGSNQPDLDSRIADHAHKLANDINSSDSARRSRHGRVESSVLPASAPPARRLPSAFEVDGTPPKNVTILHYASERVERPLLALDADDIGMRCQQDRAFRPVAPEPRDEVRFPGLRSGNDVDFEAQLFRKRGARSSAIEPSLPGGLLVLTRMRSTRRAAVRSTDDCAVTKRTADRRNGDGADLEQSDAPAAGDAHQSSSISSG
jgi:hypothetical protein